MKPVINQREERVYAASEMKLELRDATVEGKKSTEIRGYAAVFDQPTRIWDFDEIIDKRAFDKVLAADPDTRALFNHDSNFVLGRTKSKTLRLKVDKNGLFTETDPPKTPIADSIVESIRRGDVDGMSFAFTVLKARWEFSEDPAVPDKRYILEVGKLYDVGPVTFPAYPQTSVGIQENAKNLHEEARASYNALSQGKEKRSGLMMECRNADGSFDRTIEEERADAKAEAEANRNAQAAASGASQEGAEKKSDTNSDAQKPGQEAGASVLAVGEQSRAAENHGSVVSAEVLIGQRYAEGRSKQGRYS